MILYPSRKRKADNYGSLVKRLRRRPLTAETGVRFSYELFTKDKKLVLRFHAFVEQKKQKNNQTVWLVGQAVKTPPSHGGNRSSILLRAVYKR